MRPEGDAKRQQAAVTNTSTDGDDGTGRKRKKSDPTAKEEAADKERTLKDFDTVYDYLDNTKPKYEYEDFATLKEQYIPLLVKPGDDYTRQHSAVSVALTPEMRSRRAWLPKDGGIFFDDIPLHHRTDHALHPREAQRLNFCGLALKKGKWTREEDEMLVENWREYASRHDIPLRDAPKFFGATKEESLELRQSAQTTLFRPWLCKRLLHRTCEQTKRRGRVLFHPNYRLRGGQEMWTADDNEQLLRLVKAHSGNFKKVALEMGRVRYHCIHHYNWLKNHSAVDGGAMLQAKKQRAGAGDEWSDEDAERLQHLLDRFGSQWNVIALWMDRSKGSCRRYARVNELKFERRPGHQKIVAERYAVAAWSVDQLQTLVLPCNPVKFLRSEEYVGFEHGIDWFAASERTAKSATECRMKWNEFKEHILEQANNGSRKKDILVGLLQLIGALKQRAKVTRRKWTAAETQKLVDMVGEMRGCWVKIGRELKREPSSCMARFYAYNGRAAEQSGEWTSDELYRLYKFLGHELHWHPVVAALRRGSDRDIFWNDAASVTGKSARHCRNMWKRLKTQFSVSQQHLKANDVDKIAEHALQSCLAKVKEELAERDEAEALEATEPPPVEAVYEEAENGALAPPLTDVTPSQVSHCISILLEQDTLKSKRDFDADWLQINLHKTPSLASGSGDLVRHVRRMLRRCKRAGMWARLPLEQRTLRGKLKVIEFVLSRSEELLVPSRRFRKLMRKFAKKSEFALLPRDDASEEPEFVDLRLPSSSE